MRGRIVEEDIQALRERADLAAIVAEYTSLQRAGGGRLKGLCPFHQEKTPSFTVDPTRGVYHCLAAETGVTTWEGAAPIAELAGATHRLLTTNGAWVDAPVRSFGVQRLWAVRLSRSRARKTICATDGHRWLLPARGAAREVRLTAALRAGDRLASPVSDPGQGWAVEAVEPTDRVEEVYCAVVPGSHAFTIEGGILTGNCFGCGQGGDTFGFVQTLEALTFPEAVERVARTVGYELRYAELRPGERKALGRRTRLIDALGQAARLYAEQLAGPDGAAARAYLASRGVDDAAARHFGLGWAADRWDTLLRHLQQRGFAARDLVEAGLVAEGGRGMIDRFRGRVMFPIHDRAGSDVVAFGGRTLPGVELRTDGRGGPPPKYINSAESPVYKKSEILYGLGWARSEIVRRNAALVVEGYMDVIGLHLAGARHAVATCGTALTVDHLRQLERFGPRLVLALDADDAGFAAADRARGLAEEAGVLQVAVLPLPAGRDPADLAAGGPSAVEAALASVKTAVEFQLEHVLRGADVSTPEAQAEAFRRTFPLLSRIGDRFLRYRYVRDVVAPAVGLSADLIEQELDSVASETRSTQPVMAQPAVRRSNPQVQLEREVLRTALQTPQLLPPGWGRLEVDDFTFPLSRDLFAALRTVALGDLDAVLAAMPDDEVRSRVRALALSDATIEGPGQARILVTDLLAAGISRRLSDVRAELARVHDRLDPSERRRLMARQLELERQRRDLLEGRDT
ncbi:MAG: DNA primase [Egibacteraceae bacterium]